MNILYVVPWMNCKKGGLYTAVEIFSKCLIEKNIGITMLTTATLTDDQLVDERNISNGMRVVMCDRNNSDVWLYSSALRRWLVNEIDKYDLVHIHGIFTYPGFVAGKLARTNNVPYVISPHGMLGKKCFKEKAWKKIPYYIFIERRNLRQASMVHAASKMEKEGINGLRLHVKSKVVPLVEKVIINRNCRRKTSESYKLLFLSRLNEIKGLEVLISAIKLLSYTISNARLVIAGDGKKVYVNKLKDMVRDLGLNNKVQFVGFLGGEDKRRAFEDADVFVLPSYHESYGLVLAEAINYGLPVITTQNVALALEIEKLKAGRIIEVGDVYSLVKELKYLSIEKNRNRLSLGIRKMAEGLFNYENMERKLINMYDEIISKSR